MERLTEWVCDNQWYSPKKGVSPNQIHSKLGRYEDTGLEPERINHLKSKLEDLFVNTLKNNKGCSLCNTVEIEKLLTLKRGGKVELGFVGGISKFPLEDHASYCPNCGRKLVKE